jgi:hypothetical protein
LPGGPARRLAHRKVQVRPLPLQRIDIPEIGHERLKLLLCLVAVPNTAL